MPCCRHDRRASTPRIDQLRPHLHAPPPSRRIESHSLRQLTATLAACSDLVVSHHLAGLLRVTASSILQLVPARVRCVSVVAVPHRLASQTRRRNPESRGPLPDPYRSTDRDTFPAARAPFEESPPSTGGGTSLHPRCPLEVASQPVRTRGSFPAARPPTRRCSVDGSELLPSPLPVRGSVRVLPWVSIPASLHQPKPIPPQFVT